MRSEIKIKDGDWKMQKVAVLGYGVEGKCVEAYFRKHGAEVTVFDKVAPEKAAELGLEQYDLVFRSPTVSPVKLGRVLGKCSDDCGGADGCHGGHNKSADEKDCAVWERLPHNFTSVTRYFFKHCPCKIIGVTGTKGKGTTCSMIAQILRECGEKVYLVGNIGVPALTVLDELTVQDVVVYELSSFQLWDMERSPAVAVLLRVGEDHLDVHEDLADYQRAKENIYRYQKDGDVCLRMESMGELPRLLNNMQLSVIGRHNREDAMMAVRAVAAYYGVKTETELAEFVAEKRATLTKALAEYKGLPHRLQLIAKKNGVEYYDDNYASAFPALDVALRAFEDEKARVVLIAGGKDRGLDLSAMKKRIFSAKCLEKVILIGETATKLAQGESPAKYTIAKSLAEAVVQAKELAEASSTAQAKELAEASSTSTAQPKELAETSSTNTAQKVVVLMSPGAASFDMFKNFEDRGQQFQRLVRDAIKA